MPTLSGPTRDVLSDLTRPSLAMLILRGALAVALGIVAISRPALGLVFLLALFGGYALVDGGLLLVDSFRRHGDRGWTLIAGVVSIAAGIFAFARPGPTAIVLVFAVAIRSIVVGFLEFHASWQPGTTGGNKFLLVLGGILSVLFGVLVVAQPGLGLLALAWMFGFYGVLYGATQLGFAFRARSLLAPPEART